MRGAFVRRYSPLFPTSLLGPYAGASNTTGYGNTSIGTRALLANTIFVANTAIGANALDRNTTGSENTATESDALYSNNQGSRNTATGRRALIYNQTGSDNTASGFQPFNFDASGMDAFLHENDSKENVEPNAPHDQALQEKEEITYTGFVAQEVEAAARELGFDFSGVDAPKNTNDYYGLRYAEFVVPLVKAVQQQQKMIEELKNEIRALRNRK